MRCSKWRECAYYAEIGFYCNEEQPDQLRCFKKTEGEKMIYKCSYCGQKFKHWNKPIFKHMNEKHQGLMPKCKKL